jgi:hypothetical protein
MTTLWILLSVLLLLGAGLGVVLWRLLDPGPGSGPEMSEEWSAAGASVEARYRPLQRLFAAEDFDFLVSRPRAAELLARLRRQRKRVMRLFLRELRNDFLRVYSAARLLAPISADPDFAGRLLWQGIQFHGTWLALHALCTVGWIGPARVETTALVTALERLHEAVRLSFTPCAPQGQAASA